MKQGRGQLTDKVKLKSKRLLGYEISQVELRLMPYIQFTMMNSQKIEIRHINDKERKILSKWKDKGYIEGGASGLLITKDFWDKINEILFLGYVDLID